MTTSTVNFQEMVEPYTVPFDLLWAFMVVGEDKKFVFDFADLIYNSDIQITVYDNKTTNTDIDDWNYTQRTKADVDVEITAQYTDSVSGKTFSEVKNNQHVDDPYSETTYNTRKTVITTTNTINTVLTRANVWTVDYKNEYTYSEPNETGGDPNTISHDDQQYADKPDTTKKGNVDFNCEHIESAEQEVINNVINKYMDDDSAGPIVIPSENPSENHSSSTSTKPVPSASSVNVKRFFNYVNMYTKYVNISDTVTNKVETQKYIQGVPEVKEKTDKDADEPNFVTIFLKKKNRKNKKNVLSVPKWLFEIIEENDKNNSTDMLDLIKYLLYKATNKNYGKKEFDFKSVFNAANFKSLSDQYGGSSNIDGIPGQIFDFLLGKGMPAPGAAAVVGNIERESTFDPRSTNGTHTGLAQWDNNGRFQRLKAYASSQGKDWADVNIQLEFLWSELEGSYYQDVKNVMMNSTSESDLEYATWYWGRHFEVYFLGSYEGTKDTGERKIRYECAQKWYKAWQEKNQ